MSAAKAQGRSAAVQAAGLHCYVVRLEGRLDRHWAGHFGLLSLTHEDGGTTLLTAPVTDQAALHGLLAKVRDLGIGLVSVERLPVPV